MKLLESGRITLIWMGVHFADDDDNLISWQHKWARKTFAITYATLFIAFSTMHVIRFLSVQFINMEDFFFVLSLFIMTVQSSSAFTTAYLYRSLVSTVFQSLTQIYEKCKLEKFEKNMDGIVKLN